MTNFNVTLNSKIELATGRKVAAAIRASNSMDVNLSCLGVQAMAFPHHNGCVEIACNVDLVRFDSSDKRHIQEIASTNIANTSNIFI